MGKIKDIHLSSEQLSVPENGYRYGRAHFLRRRCLDVLLKAQGLSSPTIAGKVDMRQQSINKRVDRFMSEGIEGLENRPGQGARPIISRESGYDGFTATESINSDRIIEYPDGLSLCSTRQTELWLMSEISCL